MSLTDLWEKSKKELETKTGQQIIAIAGELVSPYPFM